MANQKTASTVGLGIPWWLVLLEGIAAIIIGVLLFMRPVVTTIVLIQFLGIYWLISGIFSLISLLWDRSLWGWKLFNGILGILVGALVISNPLWSTLILPTTLAIVIGTFGIVIGVIQIINAFRGGGWAVGILGGMSILLGFLLIARPVIAGLALPWMLAFLLVAGGIIAIFAAFALRNVDKQVKARAQAASSTPPVAAQKAPPSMAGTAAKAGVAAAGYEAVKKPDEGVPAPTSASVGSTAGAVSDAGSAVSFEAEVPAEVLTGNVDPGDATEMAKFKYALEYVEGIGPVYAGKLKMIGLVTCLDLLKSGSSRKGRDDIAQKSGISSLLILKWVNHVDLYRVKGVGSEYADLLEAAGVDTVVELALRNPSNLYGKMNEVNTAKALVRKMPIPSQVADWVAQAKDLPRVVSY